jgi:polyisoprenyl-phosphate glycosyltransferase
VAHPCLSIVIPVWNEQEVLPRLYKRLERVLHAVGEPAEIVFVDDGSTDATPVILAGLAAADNRVKAIHLSRNFGHQVAITAGLDAADGDAVVVMDADLQDPPELILRLVERWREGFEVVHAVRESRKDPQIKRFLASGFYRLMKRISPVDVPVDAGDFRLIDRRALDAFRTMRERSRYVRGMFAWVGFRQTSVEFARDERAAGKAKYSLARSARLAVDGILSFSDLPLRVSLLLGLIVSVGSFGIGGWAVLLKVTGVNVVPGWVSLLTPIMFVAGVQLMVLGMLGLYVGRVFDEVKQRPLYIVQQTEGFASPPAAEGTVSSALIRG